MIDEIIIKNYRNLNSAEIKPSKGVSIIVEQNGFGKTNFLESIYYSIFRNSFRPMKSYAELIQYEHDFGKVDISIGLDKLELVISQKPKLQRTVKLNGKRTPLKTPPEKFPALLFAPHSVDLVSGEPATRRNDLNNVLSIFNSKYSEWLSRYKKVLRNRNSLIKAIQEGNSTTKELSYWTDEIIKYGSLIHIERFKFFENIENFVESVSSKIYHDVFGIKASYLPNLEGNPSEIEDLYRQKYHDNEQKELIVGKTLYGIHKDDFEFTFKDNQALRYNGSRGQQRICSFIFKLAQYNLLRDSYSKEPILLIDDIFSELDKSHRENIAEFLLGLNNQIIMTGADLNEFPERLQKNATRLDLK